MNGKYKGGGCGCGASKSLGFPQTGGQKIASMKKSSQESTVNTGFSNNSGLFQTAKRRGTKSKRNNSGMQEGSFETPRRSRGEKRNSSGMQEGSFETPRRSRGEKRNIPIANSFVGGGDIISDALSAISGTSPEETPLPANSGQVNIQNSGFPPVASIVNNPTVSTPNVAVPSTPTVSSEPLTTEEGLVNPGLEYEEQKPKENSGGIMGALKGAFGLNSGTATTGGRRTRRSKKGGKKTKKIKKAKKTKKSRK